jgi:predicted Fe-Mo cluster-binding NifX family protein
MMNIVLALPVDGNEIFEHFGKASTFKIYEIEENKVVKSEVLESGALGHDEVGLWLVQHLVNAVICSGIGPGSHGALTAAGIMTLAGVKGDADEAVSKFISGTLDVVNASTCSGHSGGCHSHCCSSCGSCRNR